MAGVLAVSAAGMLQAVRTSERRRKGDGVMAWHDAADITALQEGSILECDVAGRTIALYLLGGRVFATAAICPHQSAWLAQGALDGDDVCCPRHGGRFHVPTGMQLAGPACGPLQTFAARVDGNRILVDLAQPPTTGRR